LLDVKGKYIWCEKAEYKDYEEVSMENAQEQIVNAEKIIAIIEKYLNKCWNE